MRLHRLGEVELLVAAEGVLVAQVALRVEELEVRLQLGQLVAQLRVADLVHEQVLQLLAHVRRQRVEQVLHLRHLALHLLDQLVEATAAGCRRRGRRTCCMKPSKSGSPPCIWSCSIWLRSRIMSFMRAMSSGDMLAIWLLEVLEEGLHHRLLQHLHELLELGLRLRVHELVVLQLLHLAAEVVAAGLRGSCCLRSTMFLSISANCSFVAGALLAACWPLPPWLPAGRCWPLLAALPAAPLLARLLAAGRCWPPGLLPWLAGLCAVGAVLPSPSPRARRPAGLAGRASSSRRSSRVRAPSRGSRRGASGCRRRRTRG